MSLRSTEQVYIRETRHFWQGKVREERQMLIPGLKR